MEEKIASCDVSEDKTKKACKTWSVDLYTIKGCMYCRRAKELLASYGVEFNEIDLSSNTEGRDKLVAETGHYSFPQIFIGKKFVGGCQDLYALEAEGKLKSNIFSQICRRKSSPPKRLNSARKNSMPTFHGLSSDTIEALLSVAEIDKLAKKMGEVLCPKGGVKEWVVKKFTGGGNGVKGSNILQFVIGEEKLSTTDAIKKINTDLIGKGYLFREDKKNKEDALFCVDGTYWIPYSDDDNVMNRGRRLRHPDSGMLVCIPEGTISEKQLSEVMRWVLVCLRDEFFEDNGASVDYEEMSKSDMFQVYRQLTYRLQILEMGERSRNHRMAFFINTYNSLQIDATAIKGPPTSHMQRMQWFPKISYLIGRFTLSLDDIEHSILRGNKGHVIPFLKSWLVWSDEDPRMPLILQGGEQRIHFALNCGAKSCPPIKVYSVANIAKELEMATKAFLQDNVTIDEETGTVHLSMILKWYQSDFGKNRAEVLMWVRHYLGEEKRNKLKELLDSGKYTVVYDEYDWGANNVKK